jgi:hypothetical protein
VTLTIERLVTLSKVPRQLPTARAIIDEVARHRFAAVCTSRLPRRADSEIVRIRRLEVQVKIALREFKPDALTTIWVATFIRELFSALAHPSGTGPFEILRFESRPDFLAAAIRDLVTGVTAGHWEYEEFASLFKLPTGEAILALLEEASSEMVRTLLILEGRDLLENLLDFWNQAALDRLFLRIDSLGGVSGPSDENLAIEHLIATASLLLSNHFLLSGGHFLGGDDSGERKLALKLFLLSARESDWRNGRLTSPQTISRALRVFGALLDLHKFATAAKWRLLTGAAGQPDDSIVSGLTASIGNMMATASGESRIAFTELLDKLRPVANSRIRGNLLIEFENIIATGTPESRTAFAGLFEQLVSVGGTGNGQNRPAESKWISTDCAGLFLLVRILDKLEWPDRVARLSFGAAFGRRLLTYTLAGLASAILERFSEEPMHLDSGLALFSGWIDEPDLGGFHSFLASESVETRRDLLVELLGDEITEEGSMSWKSCFDSLATHMIGEFTRHIRGFGRSTRSFVVKNFLALTGRIRIEETHLVIVFTSSPLHVVLHLSGLDDPVEAVDWLGARRIEFQTKSF